jgi:hypothetical protein
MPQHYDVIVIGSGAGSGTLTHAEHTWAAVPHDRGRRS